MRCRLFDPHAPIIRAAINAMAEPLQNSKVCEHERYSAEPGRILRQHASIIPGRAASAHLV